MELLDFAKTNTAARLRAAASRGALSHALIFSGSGDRIAAARGALRFLQRERYGRGAVGKRDGVGRASAANTVVKIADFIVIRVVRRRERVVVYGRKDRAVLGVDLEDVIAVFERGFFKIHLKAVAERHALIGDVVERGDDLVAVMVRGADNVVGALGEHRPRADGNRLRRGVLPGASCTCTVIAR